MKILIPLFLFFLQGVFVLESDADRIVNAIRSKAQESAKTALQEGQIAILPGTKGQRAIREELIVNLPNELADGFRPQVDKALELVQKGGSHSKRSLQTKFKIESVLKQFENQWKGHSKKVLTEWSIRHKSMISRISAPNTHALVKRRLPPVLGLIPVYALLAAIFGVLVVATGLSLLAECYYKVRRTHAIGLPITGTAEGFAVTPGTSGSIEMASSRHYIVTGIPVSQAIVDVSQVAHRVR